MERTSNAVRIELAGLDCILAAELAICPINGKSDRLTEYDGPKIEPPGWWEALDVLRELGAVTWHWFEVLR